MDGPRAYNRYRIKVNQPLITSFFSKPKEQATVEEINEINKVITIVLNHYFGKYYRMFKELRAWAMLAIVERHQNYDSNWSAYNYVYRISRNEIGNKISKYFKDKEEFVDEIPEQGKYSTISQPLESVNELIPYLSGEQYFQVLDVPKELIFPLLVLIEETLNKSTKDDVYFTVANLLIQINYE